MKHLSFPYTLLRSSRKTIAISITAEGQVLVRCPRRMKDTDIRRFVEEKSDWVEKHLAAIRSRPLLPRLTAEEIQHLARQAKGALPPRIAHYARQMGVSYGRVSIRSQHSRWGSCSAKGNLNFNCLLMLTPPEVRDYELCHRRQMNHSPAFWTEVESVMPGYREPKRWLKDNGPSLITRLP